MNPFQARLDGDDAVVELNVNRFVGLAVIIDVYLFEALREWFLAIVVCLWLDLCLDTDTTIGWVENCHDAARWDTNQITPNFLLGPRNNGTN